MADNSLLVVTEAEAGKMLGLSLRTMQRLRLDGGGPAFVKLTDRRIGYSVETLQQWLRTREVASTSAAA
jgi:hypothetical protein